MTQGNNDLYKGYLIMALGVYHVFRDIDKQTAYPLINQVDRIRTSDIDKDEASKLITSHLVKLTNDPTTTHGIESLIKTYMQTQDLMDLSTDKLNQIIDEFAHMEKNISFYSVFCADPNSSMHDLIYTILFNTIDVGYNYSMDIVYNSYLLYPHPELPLQLLAELSPLT